MSVMAGSERQPIEVRAGFEVFFRTHFDGVARAAALIAGDLGSGQELAQEAYLRLYERWGAMTSDDHARNFVYKVAINLARSHRRKHVRLILMRFDRDEDSEASEDAPSDGDVLVALRRLPHRQRACVVLVDLVDMDAAGVARTLGISASTVRVHLMRGRQALRAALGVEPGEDEAR